MNDKRDMVPHDGRKQMTATERRDMEEAAHLKALVARQIDTLEKAMPTHIGPWLQQANISPEVFIASFRLALVKNPEIAKCSPTSIMLACMDSAKIGLPPDGKKAAIVPYKGVATFIPMRDGIVDVLGRAGYHVSAQVIYEGEEDLLDYDLGSDPYVKFKPPLDRDDSKKVIGAFAVVTAKHGNGKWVEFMGGKELEKIARVGKTDKVRKAWPGEMHRKAPLRRIAKFLPTSPELEILNAIETKAFMAAPPMAPETKRLSDDQLLDDNAPSTEDPEGEAEGEEEDHEELSFIHRFTQMVETAPDIEVLEERAAHVLDQIDYDRLDAAEKAAFEMALRMKREEFGADPETGAMPEAEGEPTEKTKATAVAVVEHKTGKSKKMESGAEFQAFMLETLATGDSTSLFHWWQANAEAMAAADVMWPEHAARVRLVADGKGLGE